MMPHAVRAAPRYRTRRGATKRPPISLKLSSHILSSGLYAAASFSFDRATSASVIAGGAAMVRVAGAAAQAADALVRPTNAPNAIRRAQRFVEFIMIHP